MCLSLMISGFGILRLSIQHPDIWRWRGEYLVNRFNITETSLCLLGNLRKYLSYYCLSASFIFENINLFKMSLINVE